MKKWESVMAIARGGVSRRVKGKKIETVKVRDRTGNIRVFYPESIIRELCRDVLEKENLPIRLPQPSVDGRKAARLEQHGVGRRGRVRLRAIGG